ncbi:MAG: hypothetical protein KKD94_06085, partial [Nanoarchaeota archaeon]|nr:hypothetical protein [Nanoarchaeota archaeon]
MDKKKNILIEKYLEQHSLVESNIKSFNGFIENRIQQIVEELNESLIDQDVEIKFGKIKIGEPNIIEADGSINNITPITAKLRNLTYAAPVHVELSVKYENQTESAEVEIGRIPVIVRGAKCNTHGMNKEELRKNYMDPLDQGGYFIIKGNERVIVMSEDLAPNQPFIEEGKQGLTLRIFSERGSYRIPTTVSETNEGILELTFSRLRNVPILVLLKALGMVKEEEIAKRIGIENDCLIVNLYEFANLQSAEDAMMYIAEKSGIQGTKKE